jgi:hypothetical protein
MTTTAPVHRCPAIESRLHLCGRPAEYRIKGTSWCRIHARRVMEEGS